MKMRFTVLCSLLSLLCAATQAAEMNFAHITTTGYGAVTATPDMATFSVQVEQSTMSAEQAKSEADKIVVKFIEHLKQLGVKDEQLNSSNLYIAPQYYSPKNGEPELVGFKASRQISVRVDDLSHLNDYLDVALQEGINQVDSVMFKVKDEAKFKSLARQQAIADAKQKAIALAHGFERKLGALWSINYNSPNMEPVMLRTKMTSYDAVSDSYQNENLVIRDQVEVNYKLD
jgi:uncharacterized protein